MSLVTVIKDYIEIVHKIIETSPVYIVQHTDYTDLTTLYFYLINTIKHFFTDIFSLEFFQKIAAFPIIVPNIADSMISEISVLDGTFHNVFTFLDAPIDKVFSTKNEFIIITCLEKFVIGLVNSLFLWLPTSAATFLCLRRFVMQGMEIGYIAAIGTMTANIFWLICVLFGIRWIVIPWMSLDILRYWLGFMLLIKYFWDNRLPAKEIKSDLSLNIIKTKGGFHSIIAIFSNLFQVNRNLSNPIQQIFLFHFLLALTEQTSIYPFISNFSLSAQSTYLESFPSDNIINFILIHCFYLLGIFIGSFSFINFICWFWEEPAYKVYLWATKNFQKIRVGDMVRITHFIFQTLTITLACASLPYFSIEYFITKPLGFLPNDQIFHQSQNAAFLTHSTSPVLYRSPYYFPRQRFFRYDDWAEYYGKNIPLDTSLYDQGAYRLYPIEDLHYGADYEWTRRRSNHVKIRSRMKRIIWFPRNWATQIWDLAKTWSRRNVAWRNEILSQYQNNWDSKSAPFWEQIVREELSLQKSKSYFQNERNTNSPWAASPNWSQKFLASGEGFWWNWWSKNTLSDNKIWWNWILTKKNQITINNNLNEDQISLKEKLQTRDMIFANYQKLPTSYQLDYWIPQERLISLYSEQNQKQKNQLDFEIATLRKFIRKINKRIQINSSNTNSLSKHTIFSIKNAELYYKKYLFNNSFNSLLKNRKTSFFLNQNSLLNNQNISLRDSNKTLNSLLHNYSLSVSNQSSFLKKWNAIQFMQSPSTNFILDRRSKDETSINKMKQNLFILSKTNLFNNQSTSLFLTLPAQYYLHKEKSFSRKLQFYGVRTSRELKPLNNSPIFNFYMKTYFHQYKPTRLYIANTKMKRDLGAGGRNRFKSRQYANKQLKKARILSKTPWIRQWVSQSGFLTRRKRLESWIKYSHYNSSELWAFIMKADIDNFIKRQPNDHFLTNNEERLLHLRRFLLGEHYETLRWYSYMQHYRSMKTKIGGTKSFANRIYNQQFKGTFHKVRHLFALTPSLSGGGILTFDQPLYNEFSNNNQNNLFNKELIHEELLAETDKNLNFFLVKDKETNKLNLNFYSDDLIIRSSQIIKNYISEITPIRQQLIQTFLKDKNYIELTNFLSSGQKAPISFSVENQISKKQKEFLINLKEKSNLIPSSFSIDQQRRFQSILIFMFNKRQSLAKDYKRGSERLWKKWRKKYSIQKQISKQNTFVAEREFRPSSLNIETMTPDQRNTEKNKILSIYRKTDTIKKDALYKSEKNIFKDQNIFFSYRQKTDIKKALKDSILIQKYFINQNNKSGYQLIKDLDFSNNFEKKLEYYNKKEYKTENIEKIFDVKKENFSSELFKSDKTAIKELIHKIYEKSSFYDRMKLKYLTLNYWFKDLFNVSQYKWNILNINKDLIMETRKIDTKSQSLNNKNKREQLFNILSYLQNRTIRERLDINKKILTITNYNQIDNKFSIIRASRHLKRARISQRKRLSQPLQKNKNFFHFESENIQQTNPFKIYQNIDSFKPDLKVKLSKIKDYILSSDSLKNTSFFDSKLRNRTVSDNIINLIESNKIDIENKNQRNLAYIRNSNMFNLFQPFLESFYYLPRFSNLWQSNLISSDVNSKSKIDMGSIYETKQNFTPIGTQKELHRQTFNTKNKLQDNIRRKLLDNHLNRFSERRKWTNQHQTINIEIKEKLKKFIEILKQNKNTLFINEKGVDINSSFFHSNLEPHIKMNLYNNTPGSFSKDLKPEFFSLNLQRSIQSFNTKETDQPTLLSVIIREKNKSKLRLSQLSSLQPIPYNVRVLNKFKSPRNKDFAKSLNFISNFNNLNSLKIKQLMVNENSELENQSFSNFNKSFFYDILLTNLTINPNQEIKKEKVQQKGILLTILNQIQNNNSIKKINEKDNKTALLSKNFEKYLIKNFQQKIKDQLKKLENKLSKIPKEGFIENQENTQLKLEYSRKENKILTTQKKLITKRIEFLTNLNDKFKAFESWYLTLPTDWKTNKIKLIENKQSMNPSFDFKTSKKQYYFSKNFLNLLVDHCNNLIQHLDLKKESYLKTQNKMFNDLLQFELSDQNKITQKINNFNINSKNTFQFTNNLIIKEFMKKSIKNIDNANLNKVLHINKNNFNSQRSDKKLPLTINSSILKFLIKEQKVSNFDEILGSLLAIQKRGNSLSQKNLYYKNIKNQWNKKKFSNFSNFRKGENRLKNFMAIRNWTRSQARFQKRLINNKLLEYKGSLIKESKNYNSLEKKTTGQNILTIDNFIKESILKPQRFEKQQSRKRLKFKKLPRQEYSKNLQAWENYLNQKEDVKNKQFFDDLSQSFQRWKNFGFFPQKIVFQKEILNSLTFLPFDSSYYNEKLTNFYENNLQTIINLDVIKQIEYDRLIQKELNFFFNQNNLTNINLLNNKELLKIGDKDSKPLSFFYQNPIGSFDFFSEIYSETNQKEITYQNKDLINTIYEKFFVKSIQTPIDPSQINKKTLIGINTFPFYAGWDEGLRKFVLTNRLLSRRDAGYQTNTNFLDKEKENNFNIEFTQWPLQGRNAATTFFCHFPFINQPSDSSETIQYKNRTQFQQEEGISNIDLSKLENQNVGNAFSENNDVFKRIKRQKQELRNENRRNITNLVGSNEILNRRKAIFYPLKWKSIKSTTKKIILKSPLNNIKNAFNYNKLQTIDQLSYSALSTFSDLKKADSRNFRSLISKFHLLMVLRKGNTGKIRLPKLRSYKKYIKKENDILESSWKTFLSKRKLRSYNFIRQKNIRTMHLYKAQLGQKLQWTKIQWLFRKNNSRANRQSENRKNKSGAHYLRPRKKSLRRRSLGIKYKKNQQIWSFNNFSKNYWKLERKYDEGKTSMILTKKINKNFITDSSILNSSKSEFNHQGIPKQNKLELYETPYNWIQPNNSSYVYNSLFKSPSLYTPALYSILPGHGRFIPKMQTTPLPKSSVQTIKRAIRLANFEPASFIQREVLSYEWSMKQLLQNMNKRLNSSVKRLVLKNKNNDLSETNNSKSSFSIDLLVQRHLRLFKKKLIQNPIILPSSNIYLSHFSRQRSFQKRSIRLRKFNMTLAMNLYDRWFFYYYTGGREDPLQNLFQIFENLTHNISTVDINEKNESNELNIRNNLVLKNNNLENDDKNLIFKSVRKFLTQKPDQKRSFNTFLTNLKTKKPSSISKTREILDEQQNPFSSQNMKNNSLKKENIIESFSNENLDYTISQTQWWHLFNLFPQTIDGKLAQKEMLDKLSIKKTQKKQQEKDLEEDRFYFLKANKSPIIQDFRSSKNVNRHYPLNGGFIWPGDYLRLQTIMLPKEKKNKYFYNKNLLFEIQNSTKQNDPDFQPSKVNIYSKSKIVDKINEFQNFVLESK
nr:hypothetical chloroplast RF1 [Oedogonium sp. HN1801B]